MRRREETQKARKGAVFGKHEKLLFFVLWNQLLKSKETKENTESKFSTKRFFWAFVLKKQKATSKSRSQTPNISWLPYRCCGPCFLWHVAFKWHVVLSNIMYYLLQLVLSFDWLWWKWCLFKFHVQALLDACWKTSCVVNATWSVIDSYLIVSSGTGCPKVISLDVCGELVEGNIIKGYAEVAWCGGTPGKGVARWDLVFNFCRVYYLLIFPASKCKRNWNFLFDVEETVKISLGYAKSPPRNNSSKEIETDNYPWKSWFQIKKLFFR